MVRIKAIIFDLAEVLLQGLLGTENYLVPILKMPAKKIHDQFHDKNITKLLHGEISEEEYWKRIIKKNKWKIDVDFLKKAIRKNFREIKGTRTIIKKLHKKGYKLCLLSEHAKEWVDYCEKKFDYKKLFDIILYSFDISLRKTEEKAFIVILKKINTKPKECLFIDDWLENIETAKKVGLNTIQFKNPKRLKEELASFGIKI